MAESQNSQKQPASILQQSAEKLFYIVLPKDKASGPLVNLPAGAGSANLSPASAGLKLWVKIALIVLGTLAALAGGYFLYKALRPQAYDFKLPTSVNTGKPGDKNQGLGVVATTPRDWQIRYFGAEICRTQETCADSADPDRDGLSNLDEYQFGTDPNNPDSDSDGLADGDEVHIFGGSPLNARSINDPKYTDADYAKGGYDTLHLGQLLSDKQLAGIKDKLKQYGLHQPTLKTLGVEGLGRYNFIDPDAAQNQSSGAGDALQPMQSLQLPSGTDTGPEAMLDRDTQRSNTIKKLAAALLKYKADRLNYPQAANFLDMVSQVKPYNQIATNPQDPINLAPLVYNYKQLDGGKDFSLSYFSETQKQLINFNQALALKASQQESAAANDAQRTRDLEALRSALLVYSSANLAGGKNFVFPTQNAYQTELVPKYISELPKDPKTGQDYEYRVSENFDTFTLKAALESPSSGTTGYLCNQEECRNY